MSEYLNTQEAADRLQVSTRTIRRWTIDGYFPNAVKVNPRAEKSPYIIPVSDIEAFEVERDGQKMGRQNGN